MDSPKRDIQTLINTANTVDEVIDILYCAIEEETNKPEADIDVEFIQACSNYIMEIMPEEDKTPDAELDDKLSDIKSKASIIENNTSKTGSKRKIKIIVFKTAAVIAAVLLISFSILTVAATRNGYGNAWEYVREKASELFDMKKGDTQEVGGITFIKNGKSKTYSSVETLVKDIDEKMLYPSVLPDGTSINKIVVTQKDESKYSVAFNLTSDEIHVSIRNYYSFELTESEKQTEYTVNDAYIFNIYKFSDANIYQAVCHNNEFEYIITAKTYEDLITTISNFKETK